MNPPTILNHHKNPVNTSNNLWNPNMLVVVPIGALLEKNRFPTQFGGDIWKPTAICDTVSRSDNGIPIFTSGNVLYHNEPNTFPRTNNITQSKVECGCRCSHTAVAHSHQEILVAQDRPVLNLNNILEASGVIEPVKRSGRSTRSAPSVARRHDVAHRKRLNLFTSLKLGAGQRDCEDDESDADSLLSSISKEISKFDGEKSVDVGPIRSPSDDSATIRIYSQRTMVSCTPPSMSEDRYSIHSGDNSPWNLPN